MIKILFFLRVQKPLRLCLILNIKLLVSELVVYFTFGLDGSQTFIHVRHEECLLREEHQKFFGGHQPIIRLIKLNLKVYALRW